MIFERLPVDGPDFLLGTFAHALVKTLPALFAQPAALHQLLQKRLQHEAVAPRIVRRHVVQVARDQRPDIQTHNVEQPVTGALGQANGRSGQRVDFFNGVAVLDGDFVNRRAEERADAVGDEVGRILARHHAFTQPPVAEITHEVQHRGQRFRARNHFEQMQIARRVEEMRPQEMLAELAVKAF